MQLMSFMLTWPQFCAGQKTVTRRDGWLRARAGQQVQGVQKGQGLKKGEAVVRGHVIRFVDVRREFLSRMIEEEDYGRAECLAEGFPELTPVQFVAMFCRTHGTDPRDLVTRLEFTYATWRCDLAPCCEHRDVHNPAAAIGSALFTCPRRCACHD